MSRRAGTPFFELNGECDSCCFHQLHFSVGVPPSISRLTKQSIGDLFSRRHTLNSWFLEFYWSFRPGSGSIRVQPMSVLQAAIKKETARRRTFAIISHPDAGKTTLTEKLLLYGGAIHLAGAVRAKANQRSTTSDWMEIERQRGISISSIGSAIRLQWQPDQPARYAWPQGLLRRYLSNAHGCRCGRHAHRRRQRR